MGSTSYRVAVALWIGLGLFGGHRYYLGRTRTALLQTVTVGGLGFWWLIDLFRLRGTVQETNLGAFAGRRQLPRP